MKTHLQIALLCIITAVAASCNETYVINYPPTPSISEYEGSLMVKTTAKKFVSETLPTNLSPSETYKIITFPNSLQFKSIYIVADAQGKIEFEYKLDKAHEIPAGYDGIVIGIIRLINSSRSNILNIPVVYIK